MTSPPRVRFAPSPTGALHIGGLRTALYNYLLARKHGGTMILRIEDTDQGRFVPGAEEYIIESLKWAGIQIDEGVGVGGPFAPYRQSERQPLYGVYAEKLIGEGKAYYAFDTPEELETLRKKSPSFQYDNATRSGLKNSLALSVDEVKKRIVSGEHYVIRIKIPADTTIVVNDLIRGEVIVESAQVDDKVLMKSDGMPTYHLANVVDDYLMKITHVIRGEEWLPSAPLHVMLYGFLGWETSMPRFAHLPLLLKPDGNGKLSKRDADKMGFPIFPLNWKDPQTGELAIGYREAGYLPEAIINFLAFLGWNPGTTQEIFSMTELVDEFTLERIGKAGAKFDIQKAQWFNEQYLRMKPDAELLAHLETSVRDHGLTAMAPEKMLAIVQAMKDRVTFPGDFFNKARFFFERPATLDLQPVLKKWTAEGANVLAAYAGAIRGMSAFSAGKASSSLESAAASFGIKPGQVLQALRLFITGQPSGPDLMATMAILGGTECAERIDRGLATLKAKTA